MSRTESSEFQLTPAAAKYFRPRLIVVALVSLLVGGAIGYWGFRTLEEPTLALPAPVIRVANTVAPLTPAPTVTPQPVTIYVSGAVLEPQVVTLPGDSLVEDALAAAGGPAEDADLESLNLAAPLYDNQQLVVPRQAAETPAPSAAATPAPLDLNAATAAALETLPGIGPGRAQDIVAYREANGPFARVEDIQNVPGIGPATYQQIAPYLTVSP
ncbi:MAG TPA: helix-hairpin-helix domain-containing protein [Anaerolineae bacterium]|nr:helix-hairpin-helix domain-containing protein [Anaerolineae bacterium]